MQRFHDKTILVTGAANGQGAAQARLLIQEDAHVLIADIDTASGTELAASLGHRARFARLDVGSEKDWVAATAEVLRWRGRLDGLVNNAGVYNPMPLMSTDTSEFKRHFDVNQLGVFLGMRIAAAAMANAGGGAIVNIGSTAALRGSPNSFAYCATKWALRGMTKSAAASLAAHGIRVNAVHPGPMDTDMVKVRSAQANEQRRRAVPLGRYGDVDEVARCVLFLLSDDGSYMTGADITVDGGVSL